MLPIASFRIHDTTLQVTVIDGGPGVVGEGTRKLFNRMMAALRRTGFSIGRDPEIDARYKSISKEHRHGRHGELELKAHYFPTGMTLEFFQNLVRLNPHGRQHDFDRLEKMPYLMKLRWHHSIGVLTRILELSGFTPRIEVKSPNPDPLAFFNAQWDSDSDRFYGRHRFKRGSDGWPVSVEMTYPKPVDGTGQPIAQGAVRYFRTRNGHVMRGRCYGGIGGQWIVVYGPGRKDFTHLSGHELSPEMGERKFHPAVRREKALRKELARAVDAQNFERAIVLRDLVSREFPLIPKAA